MAERRARLALARGDVTMAAAELWSALRHVLARGRDDVAPEGSARILLELTHRVREGDMNDALKRIAALDTVDNDIMRIRVETLDA